MRELSFAIVGAAALIAIGLWAIGQADTTEEWTQVTKTAHTIAPPVNMDAAPTHVSGSVSELSDTLTN